MSSTASEVAGVADRATSANASPVTVVRRFLDSLAAGNIDDAAELLDADVDYTNVSLPTIRGRERVRKALGSAMGLPGAGFEVYFHSVTDDGDTVLTERTDVLTWGRFRAQFWVCGRFDVRDGRIVLWRDYFDWLNITVAMLRGLAGVAIPSIRAKPPITT